MELIIVIAIIGILALIAVPRLTGFTDRAKVRADEATAKSIENAIKLLAASENISLSEFVGKTIEFDGNDAKWGSTGAPKDRENNDIGISELEKLVELNEPQQTGKTHWEIIGLDDDGNTVTNANQAVNIKVEVRPAQ